MAGDEKQGDKLTLKQWKFIEYFLGEANGNATEAGRLAGYTSPNVQAARLLANVSIRKAIDERLAPLAMSANEVLNRLSEHARADVADLDDLIRVETVDGEPKITIDLKGARRKGVSRLIRKITPHRNGVTIELHDAQAALDKLARCHGLYKDKLDVTTTDTPPRLDVPRADERPKSEGQG